MTKGRAIFATILLVLSLFNTIGIISYFCSSNGGFDPIVYLFEIMIMSYLPALGAMWTMGERYKPSGCLVFIFDLILCPLLPLILLPILIKAFIRRDFDD